MTYWASNQGTSLDNDKQVLSPELAKFTKATGIKVVYDVYDTMETLEAKGCIDPDRLADAIALLEELGGDLRTLAQLDEPVSIRLLKRAAADAKSKVEAERQMMGMSMGKVDDDVTGTMHTSVIELELTVGGQKKPYLMTLRRYKVQAPSGYKPMSRWVVSGFAPKA